MGTVNVIPAFRYRDADAGIRWLKEVLGFTEHAVYRDGKGVIMHAELLFGNGMVMIGTVGANAYTAEWFTQPDETGGKLTASAYLIVKDCEPVYQAAKAAGASIIQDLETKEYGGKAFTVRDPEGQQWSIGEYDPWASQS